MRSEHGHGELPEGRHLHGLPEERWVRFRQAVFECDSKTGDAVGGLRRGWRRRPEGIVAKLLAKHEQMLMVAEALEVRDEQQPAQVHVGNDLGDRPATVRIMSAEIEQAKLALRERLRAARKKMSAAEQQLASAELCARLQEQGVWQQARGVLLFWPLPDEPDVRALLTVALATGKLGALPRFDAASGEYGAARVTDPVRDLTAGRFGVSEPAGHCPQVQLNHLDFVLVPGVAFDFAGGRLGRGKGYYDRLLALVPGMKCGAAFDAQVVAAVPREPHDVQLNCILTPTRWHPVVRPRQV